MSNPHIGRNNLNVGIVGAGIMGRLIALRGEGLGWKITLFDKGDESGSSSCSFRPPAMLAPVCEMDGSEPLIAELGKASMPLWRDIVDTTGGKVFFQQMGSIIVAHPHDRTEMPRFARSLESRAGAASFRMVGADELRDLEPELDRCFTGGMYVPDEGQIDSRPMLAALAVTLKAKGIACHFNTAIPAIGANKVVANDTQHDFDLVIDARGYGAKDDLPDLRAVRGELLRISAPDVHLRRPVRLLHPRYPIYVVPHQHGEYVIGATSVESEDDSPMSVRSALELLSTLFALNAGFGEARILEMSSGLRPTFPDNMPRIIATPGLLRVNGLYRHGYLIAPQMAKIVCDYVAADSIDPAYASLFRSAP